MEELSPEPRGPTPLAENHEGEMLMARRGIRIAVRALILREGRLLLTRCRDREGDWYCLPGGGQGAGETLPAALIRECREEIGAEVEVGSLRFVRDYIAANHDFSYLEEATHQLELFFDCAVPGDYVVGNGPEPDSNQVGVAWLDARALADSRVYPRRLREVVDPRTAARLPLYWGDEN